MSRALVLLDVDGVLNAVGPRAAGAWSDEQRGRAHALDRSWPLRWSPTVAAAVRGWLAVADVQWLTTWGHAANAGLHDVLGLPRLEVAGTYDDLRYEDGEPDTEAAAPAAVTPAAPDRLSGAWWKFDVVRQVVRDRPDVRLVWIDDDLAGRADLQRWVGESVESLLVAPDPRTGLVQADLDEVARFLAR